MAGRVEKTVFISYRRTNFWTALAVYKELHSNGFDVFFDYKNIPSGDFEQVIVENVKSRAHFIIILSPSALERCHEPGDWLRREIELALENNRNIIPLIMEGFDFGSATTLKALTGNLANLKLYNAIGIPAEYFDDAMTKLRSERFLNRPLETVSHPVSDKTKSISENQKSAANKAEPVQEEQLTAQTWFERGYLFHNENNYEEAIRCYSEAVKLDSSYFWAYGNLGNIYKNKGDLEKAFFNYKKVLELSPSDDRTYYHLGTLLQILNRIEDAEANYRKAVEFNPENFRAYAALASISKQLGKEITKENMGKVRKSMPKDDWYNLACLESVSDNFDLAFEYLEKASKREKFSPSWAWQDPDLQWIRDDPRFTKIVGAKPK